MEICRSLPYLTLGGTPQTSRLAGLAEVASPDCRLCDPGLLDYVMDQLDQNRKLEIKQKKYDITRMM